MQSMFTALRRLPSAGLLSVALLVVACGVQTTTAGSESSASVPWTDRPGIALANAATPEAPRCHGTDIQASAGKVGAYRSKATQELLLTNKGQAACSLGATPGLKVDLDAGGQQAVDSGAVTNSVYLAPGQTGRVLIGTPGSCPNAGHPKTASTVHVMFDDGTTVAMGGVWVNVECGGPSVVLFEGGSPPTPSPTSLSALKASIAVPATVAHGTEVTYMVTLKNPTNQAIPLNPCPSYTEVMGRGLATDTRATFVLNCQAVSSIPAGSSVAFQMRITTPSSTGLTKLGWVLEVPAGPSAGASVAVT